MKKRASILRSPASMHSVEAMCVLPVPASPISARSSPRSRSPSGVRPCPPRPPCGRGPPVSGHRRPPPSGSRRRPTGRRRRAPRSRRRCARTARRRSRRRAHARPRLRVPLTAYQQRSGDVSPRTGAAPSWPCLCRTCGPPFRSCPRRSNFLSAVPNFGSRGDGVRMA